jgi:hypothetical protein
MVAKEFQINIDGYWHEQNKSELPIKSGIYCVYTCTHDGNQGEVEVSRLIYVGSAKNVNEKIAKAENLSQWQSYLSVSEQLCYTFGAVDSSFMERCASAIVFIHRPPANDGQANTFPFEPTMIVLSGLTHFLRTTFLVT